MAVNFRGRHFLKLDDFTKEELTYILDMADFIKKNQKLGIYDGILKNKILGMIFEKNSTRTRLSFEIGMKQLGGDAIYMDSKGTHIGKSESVADTARVMSRYLDGIMIRTYGQDIIEEMAKHSTIPVINALTDDYHPCQIMADFQTIREKKGKLEGLKMAYIGDCANVANSLLIGGVIMGMDVSIACPKEYQVEDKFLKIAKELAKKSGSQILITENIEEAVKEADVLYTDIWVSMGKEEEVAKRYEAFKGYQINQRILNLAKKNAIVMHCLPAHRGEEITDEVIDGPNSVVFDEAENRLHAQKAIMALFMK